MHDTQCDCQIFHLTLHWLKKLAHLHSWGGLDWRTEKSGFLQILGDLDLELQSIGGTWGLRALDWIASPFLISTIDPQWQEENRVK